MIVAPNCPAVSAERPPPNFPTAVRRGETMAARRNVMMSTPVDSTDCGFMDWGDGSGWRAPADRRRPSGREDSARSDPRGCGRRRRRSEEHTSELQSLMRISYAVFCLKKNIYLPGTNAQPVVTRSRYN